MALRTALFIAAFALACQPLDPGSTDAGTGDSGALFDAGTAFDAGTVDAGVVTTVRIHYPAAGKTFFIRGSRAPLNWNSGAPLGTATNDTLTYTVKDLAGPLEFKPLVDDTTWSRGPNYSVQPGASIDIYPHFYNANGTWSRRWPAVTSASLGNTRGVWVYLPPTYAENTQARFPVVYMHDGQNVFDPTTAFGGNPWRAQDAVDVGAEDGTIREAIVVAPENTADRIGEYTPTADLTYPGSGKGDRYLTFLVDELKPKVDSELRTLTSRADTVIAGSSLGGLISSYAGVTKPQVFGLIGSFSPSVWWDSQSLLTSVSMTQPAPNRPLRVYVDVGTVSDGEATTAQLVAAYRTLGYQEGSTLLYVVQQGGAHNETYWRQRLPGALRFLLGPGR